MQNKTKLTIFTILSVLLASTIVMSISIPLLLNYVENTYIKIQLEANKSQSTILAKFLETNLNQNAEEEGISEKFQDVIVGNQTDKGFVCVIDTNGSFITHPNANIIEEMLLKKFQDAIAGSQTESGFVCIIDSTGKFITHPDESIIGKNIKGMNINYKSEQEGILDNWFNSLQKNMPSGGLINFDNENTEIVYSVSLNDKPWKINSHENIKKIKADIKILQSRLVLGSTIITILIALFASYLVRKVSYKYEKQIEDYNIQLQSNIANLNKANLDLETLNNEKNNILHIVAHDLKNPLAGILLNIEIITNYFSKMTKEDIIAKLNGISSTTNYMKDIVSKLLDKETINNAKIKIKNENFEPNKLIYELIEQFSDQANKKSIVINYNNEIENLKINNDKNIFREVADNYLSNALKYSPFSKNIWVGLKQTAENNDHYLIFSVKDEGPGISEDDQSNLFQKFNKLTAQPTDGEDSTGIGLFGVKRNAELIGAEVYCNSKIGEGAEFVFKIKL